MTVERQHIPYYLAFNSIYRLGSSCVVSIVDSFGGDVEAAWHNPGKWREAAALSPALATFAVDKQRSIDPAALYAEFMAVGCGITCITDEDYPSSLVNISSPPLLLFYRGSLPPGDELALAIIGSRRATAYGRQVADIFARDLAAQGAWIISGMARGIDSICHRAAIEVGGKTLAVLGCGLDVIYPPENRDLYLKVCDHGAVVSEFPFGTAALAQNFPRRNRIISGFAQGVVVVEADLNSGTMHTVNYALEQGRDVFAVPGPITSPCSRGTNKLIRECPSMVMATCSADIWSRYSQRPLQRAVTKKHTKVSSSTSELEKILLELLVNPVQFDRIAAAAEVNIEPAKLASALTMLEIKGLIRQLPGKYYQTVVKRI